MAGPKIIAIYRPPKTGSLRFVVHSKTSSTHETYDRYVGGTLGEMILKVFTILDAADPQFLQRLQLLDDKEFQSSPFKSRRYVADRPDLLYINSPHLTRQHSVKFRNCWIATNVNRTVALHIVWLACKAAGIKCESIRNVAM